MCRVVFGDTMGGMKGECRTKKNGYGYNCNHVTFMIVEIIKLSYMPINGRTFWKKLGTFLAERWHESRSFMPIKSQFP